MISVTKLYDYLNWMFAFVVLLCIATFISTVIIYFKLSNTVVDTSQFVQNSIDDARQNIREDLKKISSELDTQAEELSVIRWRTDWIATNIDSLTWSITIEKNISPVNLIHYFAEVEICSEDYPSYKVKIDFYWINPRIEDGKLMVLSDRFTADYHEYFPIFDKNIGYDANLCGLKLLNK